jgi:hypothetical protein
MSVAVSRLGKYSRPKLLLLQRNHTLQKCSTGTPVGPDETTVPVLTDLRRRRALSLRCGCLSSTSPCLSVQLTRVSERSVTSKIQHLDLFLMRTAWVLTPN